MRPEDKSRDPISTNMVMFSRARASERIINLRSDTGNVFTVNHYKTEKKERITLCMRARRPINTCGYTTAKPYARLIDLNSPPYPLTDTNESDAPVTKRRTDVIL